VVETRHALLERSRPTLKRSPPETWRSLGATYPLADRAVVLPHVIGDVGTRSDPYPEANIAA